LVCQQQANAEENKSSCLSSVYLMYLSRVAVGSICLEAGNGKNDRNPAKVSQ